MILGGILILLGSFTYRPVSKAGLRCYQGAAALFILSGTLWFLHQYGSVNWIRENDDFLTFWSSTCGDVAGGMIIVLLALRADKGFLSQSKKKS
jgi:hypothetical protein